MSDYKPVACDAHSLYELAVMQKQRATIRWQDGESVTEAQLLPVDVVTSNREEFLVCDDDSGNRYRIRLDRILDFTLAG